MLTSVPVAVLIMDPPVGDYVKSLPDGTLLKVDHCSNEHAYSRMHSLAPEFNTTSILPPEASDWNQGCLRPQYHSMFDDILSVDSSSQHQLLHHPRTSTEIARKLAICHFLTFLRRRILNMLRLQANPHAPALHINRCDYLRRFGSGMLSSWHHELFGFVVNVKYIMGIMAQEADDNVVALGLLVNLDTTTTTTRQHAANVVPLDIPQWERDGWIAIQEHCGKIIAMADAFLQSYLQFSSMQEAQAANRNALSLARITNLTMVFIPLGTVAAIFSMSDEFMPGKGKSWIFWVTALPVLLIMFLLTSEARLVVMLYWKEGRERWKRDRVEAKHIP